MQLNRTRGVHLMFLLAQLALATAVFWIWLPLSHADEDVRLLPLGRYALCTGLVWGGLILGWLTEADRSYLAQPTFRTATRSALWQVTFAGGLLLVYLVGFQQQISRLFLFGYLPLLYLALVATVRFLPPFLAGLLFAGPYEQRVALVGDPARAAPLLRWLQDKASIGYETIGIICDEAEHPPGTRPKRLGALGELDQAIAEWDLTQLVLVGLPDRAETLHRCIEVSERSGVRLLIDCDFERQFRHAVSFFEDGGRRFLALRREPLEDPFNRLLKWGLDVAVALPVVVLVLPWVALGVWALQRWQSPGPLLHRRFRSGLQNRPFEMLKFRTMHVDPGDEARQARPADPRVYPAGRWLRRFSLDELPQFLNVLRGDMSVVGPRPHLREHDAAFARVMANYHVRAMVKPGITGLAQVQGLRGEVLGERDVAARVRADIHYLEHWSLELDLWILVRTAWQMVRPPRSAY